MSDPQPLGNPDPLKRRCTAKSKRTGEQCQRPPILGTNVCRNHGGAAPQVKRKARQRIEEAADRMARQLLKMATDDDVADSVKLAAIKDALDRAGISAKTQVEVEVGVKPYERIADGALVPLSRAESRARRGLSDRGSEGVETPRFAEPPALASGAGPIGNTGLHEVVDAEIVDDPGPYGGQGSPGMGARSASPTSSRPSGGNGPTPENATGERRVPPWAETPTTQRPGSALMPVEDAQRLAADTNRRAGVYGP